VLPDAATSCHRTVPSGALPWPSRVRPALSTPVTPSYRVASAAARGKTPVPATGAPVRTSAAVSHAVRASTSRLRRRDAAPLRAEAYSRPGAAAPLARGTRARLSRGGGPTSFVAGQFCASRVQLGLAAPALWCGAGAAAGSRSASGSAAHLRSNHSIWPIHSFGSGRVAAPARCVPQLL
jgi:hypothetical protein